jgi:hypothetical protein
MDLCNLVAVNRTETEREIKKKAKEFQLDDKKVNKPYAIFLTDINENNINKYGYKS